MPRTPPLTKQALAAKIGEGLNLPVSRVEEILGHMFKEISEHLAAGAAAEFRDFGVFDVVARKERTAPNLLTPEMPLTIPPTAAIRFRPGKLLKKRVLRLTPAMVKEEAEKTARLGVG